MTKRDFTMIAGVINRATAVDETARAQMARLFADALAQTNPRFDRARFLRACEALD